MEKTWDNSSLNNSKWIDVLAILSIFLSLFAFLCFTGTLTSGYHFVDDHEMLRMSSYLGSHSFLQLARDLSRGMLQVRFRPLFFPYQYFMVWLFGVNFFKLSLFVGTMGAVTGSFFYAGFRKLGHNVLSSLTFVALALIGPQMAIWWRVGTNEPIGVLFLSLSFYFMARCLGRKTYTRENVLFAVFLVLSTLCKESFVLVVPAFIVFKIWNESRVFKISIMGSIRKNYLSLVPLTVMLAELLLIKYVVGANQIGYAGATNSLTELYIGIKNIILSPAALRNWFKLLAIVSAAYLVSHASVKGKTIQIIINNYMKLCAYLAFGILLVVPQILLHAKSGMGERYLLPTTIGMAIVLIIIIEEIDRKFFKFFTAVIAATYLLISLTASVSSAKSFALDGQDANLLFKAVIQNSQPQSDILLVVDPVRDFEISDSIKAYLSFYDRNNLYGYALRDEAANNFEGDLRNKWHGWFNNREYGDIGHEPDIIIVFNKSQSENFFTQSRITTSDYEQVQTQMSLHAVFQKR